MKETFKEMFHVGDIVMINKKAWEIVKVYRSEKAYRVERYNPQPEEEWLILYPDHSEIQALITEFGERQITLEEV